MGVPDLHPVMTDSNDFKTLLAIETANRNNLHLESVVNRFLTGVGTKAWEKTFGPHWHEAWNRK
jgi:hypothetical protein